MMGRTTRADESFGTGHILAQDAHEIERLASAHLCKSLLVNFWSVASSVVSPCICRNGVVPAGCNRVGVTACRAASHDERGDKRASLCRIGLATSSMLSAAPIVGR
jgi:hypothetical protein